MDFALAHNVFCAFDLSPNFSTCNLPLLAFRKRDQESHPLPHAHYYIHIYMEVKLNRIFNSPQDSKVKGPRS